MLNAFSNSHDLDPSSLGTVFLFQSVTVGQYSFILGPFEPTILPPKTIAIPSLVSLAAKCPPAGVPCATFRVLVLLQSRSTNCTYF
ncbi:hypothetical protein CEXT_141441 [Caerostris extrusa]|uniref:Uncharacterized protein n=1 Tax=Caerostris extrusa TaxID=172846 RepID=A0AAV4R4B9_CAEEX|nr:hypothetical protein CEXT_141441 [Caerostris extrusa]